MGWASGSYLAEDVWKLVKDHVPDAEQRRVARAILQLFEEHDADDPVTGPGTLYTTAKGRRTMKGIEHD
jgi:hypothetical protein